MRKQHSPRPTNSTIFTYQTAAPTDSLGRQSQGYLNDKSRQIGRVYMLRPLRPPSSSKRLISQAPTAQQEDGSSYPTIVNSQTGELL
jgi:hypothetical protein